ncbi:MAG: VOC family protein [Woeseiaceae bacterium]
MKIHYIEMVSSDVTATCHLHECIDGLEFSSPDPDLGGARVALRPDGVRIGVRAPMHEAEQPLTRHYFLTEDITSTLAQAVSAGAITLLPPMPLGPHGSCAIVESGGVQIGFWSID